MGDYYAGRRVVVTGGRGFLGREVCRLLKERQAEVCAVGSRDYNLIEQADVRRMYAEQRPSLLIHLAAACGGIQANVANPGRFLYENAMMGLMVLEEGRQAGIDKLVLISTTCAYPYEVPLPQHEDTLWNGPPPGATGPYGMAKRLLHEACATYEKQYGCRSAVLIIANLYGPDDHFEPEYSHVIAAMVRRFVEAQRQGIPEVTLWGTGRATREFMHVRDAARGILCAGEREVSPQPINVGTGVEISIFQLATLIAKTVGYTGTLLWDPSKPEGQLRRVLDVERARQRLGFATEIALEEGIRETVEWYKQNVP
ncbi:MAG: NAD-dependent epimerase/dehydratase family protein [Magnetococcus sp. YQC-3]